MGRHSKPRKLAAAPFAAAALVPVGVLTAAATTGHHDPSADHRSTAQATGIRVAADISEQTPASAPRTAASAVTVASDKATGPIAHQPPPVPVPAAVTDGQVPDIAYKAYVNASQRLATEMPHCGITWNVIAGIGRVESEHANGGKTDTSGTLLQPIYGPRLDGSLAGNQVVTDTDHGALDGDPVYDRAVGPMQFLPSTWEKYAEDGNGDGKADPQNIYDAALTTGRYLCSGNLDLRDVAQQVTAILRYNNSMTYVDNVLGFARSY